MSDCVDLRESQLYESSLLDDGKIIGQCHLQPPLLCHESVVLAHMGEQFLSTHSREGGRWLSEW